MRTLRFVMALAPLVVVSGKARAERDLIVGFQESGHLVFDQLSAARLGAGDGLSYAGPAGFTTRTTKIGDDKMAATSIWLAPSADVFVTDHVSLGGLVEVAHTWGSVEHAGQRYELPGATSFTAVPRAGFYVPIGERFGLWPRVGIGYRSAQSAQIRGDAATNETFRSMLLDAELSVVYRLDEHFFLRVGPKIAVTLGGTATSEAGSADASSTQIAAVLGFGVNLE